MSYYPRGHVAEDDDVDNFEEYDRTPYGGGYDQSLTYGRALAPSDEICYQPSSSYGYDRPQYSSYVEQSGYVVSQEYGGSESGYGGEGEGYDGNFEENQRLGYGRSEDDDGYDRRRYGGGDKGSYGGGDDDRGGYGGGGGGGDDYNNRFRYGGEEGYGGQKYGDDDSGDEDEKRSNRQHYYDD